MRNLSVTDTAVGLKKAAEQQRVNAVALTTAVKRTNFQEVCE